MGERKEVLDVNITHGNFTLMRYRTRQEGGDGEYLFFALGRVIRSGLHFRRESIRSPTQK